MLEGSGVFERESARGVARGQELPLGPRIGRYPNTLEGPPGSPRVDGWGSSPVSEAALQSAPGRGGSSIGRASRSQCEGRGFKPRPLHHPGPVALSAAAWRAWRTPARAQSAPPVPALRQIVFLHVPLEPCDHLEDPRPEHLGLPVPEALDRTQSGFIGRTLHGQAAQEKPMQ